VNAVKPTIGWLISIISIGILLFVVGVMLGARMERNRFEVAKAFATTAAEEYLAAGNVDRALSTLYFAKAYDPIEGGIDGLLGRAYQAKGNPCMAEAFYESNVNYMERNGLTELLPSYRQTKELLTESTKTCLAARQRAAGH
jgi:hypothetical protein